MSSQSGPMPVYELDNSGNEVKQGIMLTNPPPPPPNPPQSPVVPSAEPGNNNNDESARYSALGGHPPSSHPSTQPTSPIIPPMHQQDQIIPSPVSQGQAHWSGVYGGEQYNGPHSRVTSGQYGPPSTSYTGAAPSYHEQHQQQGGYMYPPNTQGNHPHHSYYGQQPGGQQKPEYTQYAGGEAMMLQSPPPPAVGPPPAGADGAAGPARKQICGLRRSTFWLIFTVVVLIVLGALLGGILGGVVFKKDDDSSSSSSETDLVVTITDDFITTPITSTTPPTTTPLTTTTTTSEPSPTYLFSLPTGAWTLNGERSLLNGACIPDPPTTGETNSPPALFYCEKFAEFTVQVSSDDTHGYILSGDEPTTFRGLPGIPPSSNSMFWAFNTTYQKPVDPADVAVEGRCILLLGLSVLLGQDRDDYTWVEVSTSMSDCTLANGVTVESISQCACGYFPVGFGTGGTKAKTKRTVGYGKGYKGPREIEGSPLWME